MTGTSVMKVLRLTSIENSVLQDLEELFFRTPVNSLVSHQITQGHG